MSYYLSFNNSQKDKLLEEKNVFFSDEAAQLRLGEEADSSWWKLLLSASTWKTTIAQVVLQYFNKVESTENMCKERNPIENFWQAVVLLAAYVEVVWHIQLKSSFQSDGGWIYGRGEAFWTPWRREVQARRPRHVLCQVLNHKTMLVSPPPFKDRRKTMGQASLCCTGEYASQVSIKDRWSGRKLKIPWRQVWWQIGFPWWLAGSRGEYRDCS